MLKLPLFSSQLSPNKTTDHFSAKKRVIFQLLKKHFKETGALKMAALNRIKSIGVKSGSDCVNQS